MPLFERRNDLDPDKLKQPPSKGGPASKYSIDDLLECLGNDELISADFKKRFMGPPWKASDSTFDRLLRKAAQVGAVHKSAIDGKWERDLKWKKIRSQ
jgi:hypothetical protein